MRIENFELEVRVHGSLVREYSHRDWKVYIEGRRGSNFTLRVRNNGSKKILAVPTVDGLSVMDGKQGNFESLGYVINPCSFVDVPGWRLNNNEVAQFFFSAPHESYAAKMDTPNNIGVIGCAIFEEKQPAYAIAPVLQPWQKPNWWGDHESLRSETPKGIRTLGSLGTGFGERTQHYVRYVQFEKAASTPVCVLEIHYDDRAGLEARGIALRGIPEVGHPTPFPAEEVGCTPPKNWKR